MKARLVVALATLLLACSSRERAPRSSGFEDDPDAGLVGETSPFIEVSNSEGPPAPDAAGFCGNEFFKVYQEPPNLYFVLDRSGSMVANAGKSGVTRYDAVRAAVVDVVRTLGNRAAYGVTVFPGEPLGIGCTAGIEVFKTQLGDPPGPTDGPVTNALRMATNLELVGGTPTSATLFQLATTLPALEGKTAVVLATDGGPNCNDSYVCEYTECVYNIEGSTLYGKDCTPTYNCCDSSIPDGPGVLMCLDSIPTIQSVQKLRDVGIRTFVVGIPGSTYYATLLNQLATVGGSARPQPPYYYRIDDMEALSQTLLQIGNKVLVTCQFVLEEEPPDSNFVNVYLDQTALQYDEANGWTWKTSTSLELHGDACQKLENGEVGQVQVVAGCPTKQPR